MQDADIVKVYQSIFSDERGARYDKAEGGFSRYNGVLADEDAGHKYLRGVKTPLVWT